MWFYNQIINHRLFLAIGNRESSSLWMFFFIIISVNKLVTVGSWKKKKEGESAIWYNKVLRSKSTLPASSHQLLKVTSVSRGSLIWGTRIMDSLTPTRTLMSTICVLKYNFCHLILLTFWIRLQIIVYEVVPMDIKRNS